MKGNHMTDLISKAELFNRLATANDKAEIFSIIQEMPTVALQIYDNQATWYVKEQVSEYRDAYDSPLFRLECSKCHKTEIGGIVHLPYVCGQCGARMEGARR